MFTRGTERHITKIEPKIQAYEQYGPPGGGYQQYRQMSLDDLLLENRIIFLIGEISYGRAAEVIMKILYLDNQKRNNEISLYINSPGGSVDDTMAIYDTMRFVSSPISTYCIGRTSPAVRSYSPPVQRASVSPSPTPKLCSISRGAAFMGRRRT